MIIEFNYFVTAECHECILARVEKEKIDRLTYNQAKIYIQCVDDGEENEVNK